MMTENLAARDVRKIASAVEKLTERDARKITNALDALREQQTQLSDAISGITRTQTGLLRDQQALRKEVNDFQERFTVWSRRDAHAKELQWVQTRLVEVRQELASRFGSYDDVRRQARGLLAALDFGIAPSAMNATSEALLLQASRYWLASAVLALDGWARGGDQTRAGRARNVAYARDENRTALFFALVLRRQGRQRVAADWATRYVARQDPKQLTDEFPVVLDAVTAGVFGPEVQSLVITRMIEWYGFLSDDPATTNAQVARWRAYVAGRVGEPEGTYAYLSEYADWSRLQEISVAVTPYGLVDEELHKLFQGDPLLLDEPHQQMDDVLDRLVDAPDRAEQKLRHAEQQLIDRRRRLEGFDPGSTDQPSRPAGGRDSTGPAAPTKVGVDFLTLLSNAAIEPEVMKVSPVTQQLATALACRWIVAAVDQLEADTQELIDEAISITVETWQCDVTTTASEPALVAQFEAHVDRETAVAVHGVRMPGRSWAAIVLGAVTATLAAPGVAGGVALGTSVERALQTVAGLQALLGFAWTVNRYRVTEPRVEVVVVKRRGWGRLLAGLVGRRWRRSRQQREPGERRRGVAALLVDVVRLSVLTAFFGVPALILLSVRRGAVDLAAFHLVLVVQGLLLGVVVVRHWWRIRRPEQAGRIEADGAHRKQKGGLALVQTLRELGQLRGQWKTELARAEVLRRYLASVAGAGPGSGATRGMVLTDFPEGEVPWAGGGASASSSFGTELVDDGLPGSDANPKQPKWDIETPQDQ